MFIQSKNKRQKWYWQALSWPRKRISIPVSSPAQRCSVSCPHQPIGIDVPALMDCRMEGCRCPTAHVITVYLQMGCWHSQHLGEEIGYCGTSTEPQLAFFLLTLLFYLPISAFAAAFGLHDWRWLSDSLQLALKLLSTKHLAQRDHIVIYHLTLRGTRYVQCIANIECKRIQMVASIPVFLCRRRWKASFIFLDILLLADKVARCPPTTQYHTHCGHRTSTHHRRKLPQFANQGLYCLSSSIETIFET